MEDRLQDGIYFRSGESPPPCFRILLLNVSPGTQPGNLRTSLDAVTQMLADLKRGQVRELEGQNDRETDISSEQFGDLAALLAFGRRLFDDRLHDPPLTEEDRPEFLAYLPEGAEPFPKIRWNEGEGQLNPGQADLLIQLTGSREAAVNRAAVEIWKLTVDEQLVLEPQALFAGFGRGDGRGWLEFHDGVSNIPTTERLAALEAPDDPAWMGGGTYLAFFRFAVDLPAWRRLSRGEQELIIGRDKLSGAPLVAADRHGDELTPVPAEPLGQSEAEHRDPPQTTDPVLEASHLHRANQNRASPHAPAGLRIFRQGYDFLDELGAEGPHVGLNFVSFQRDLGTLQHILHLPGWLGDVNFGGPTEPESGEPPQFDLISLLAGGFYAVPPRARPFAGAELFAG